MVHVGAQAGVINHHLIDTRSPFECKNWEEQSIRSIARTAAGRALTGCRGPSISASVPSPAGILSSHVKSNMMHWHSVESQFNKSCIPDDNIKNMKQRWTSVLLTWSNIVIWHKSVVTLSLFHYSYNFWGHFDQLCLWCWFWYWMITLILQNYLHCW